MIRRNVEKAAPLNTISHRIYDESSAKMKSLCVALLLLVLGELVSDAAAYKKYTDPLQIMKPDEVRKDAFNWQVQLFDWKKIGVEMFGALRSLFRM